MQINPCKICGNCEFRYLFEGKDRLYHLPGDFKLFRCHSCGLILVHPPLHKRDIKEYYPANYFAYKDSSRVSPPRSRNAKFIYYLKHPLRALNGLLYSKLLSQNKDLKVAPGSRILDIGCGDGRYLLEKRSLGCICFGNDISLEALRRLRENAPDIETRCGDLWEVHYPEKYFDAINMSHVLEHVGEIDKLLIELRRIVKDSGLLRIQIPNAASLTCAIFGKCWIALDVPRHVYVFSLTNLKKFFSDAGFEIVSSRTIENSFSVIGSFFYVFNALFKKKFELLHCERIWNNEVLKLLLFPYSLVVNLCKVGDTAEFVLKKKVN